MKQIHFAGPLIENDDIKIINQSVSKGFYDNYKKYSNEFIKNLEKYFNVKYALTTFTCTHAMHLAAISIGLNKGDEVICPEISWVATAHSLSHHNLKLKFCDIDIKTLCMCPTSLEKNITRKTKAIMVVHAFGHPANMVEIMKIAKKYNLKVIEDAAPSLGSHIRGKKTGTFGDVGCFSFQGAKIITTNEGGVLITNRKKTIEKARLFSYLGRTDRKAAFWSDHIGYRYQMSNLNSALGITQLNKINKIIKIKRNIFNNYKRNFLNNINLNFIDEPSYGFSNCTYPNIILSKGNKKRRDNLIKYLNNHKISARAMFPQLSQMPMHKTNKKNINSIKAANLGITLPSPVYLNKKQIDYITEKINKFLIK